jgi:hypothetical protein
MIQKSAKMRKKEQKGANKNIVIIIMVFVLKKINKIKS